MITKPFFLAVVSVFFAVQPALSAVRVVEAKKDLLRLSPEIAAAGEAAVAADAISVADLSSDSLPALIDCPGADWGLALGTAGSLVVFDPSCTSVAQSFPLANVFQLGFRFPGSTDFLAAHVRQGKAMLSRVDLLNGKILWSRENDFATRYCLEEKNFFPFRFLLGNPFGVNEVQMYVYRLLPTVHFDPSGNRLLLEGVTASGKTRMFSGIFSRKDVLDFRNKILVLDAASGQVVLEEEYDLQRGIGRALKVFISLGHGEFKVVDAETLKTVMSGRFEPGDVLVKKGYTPPFEIRERDLVLLSDIDALMTDGGLFLASYDYKRSLTSFKHPHGVIETLWQKFAASGKRLGPIEPLPPTSPSFLVRDQGRGAGPVVMLGIENKFMGPQAAHLVIVKKDGAISEAPLPKVKGANDFFHDGRNFYTLARGTMYRGEIGQEDSQPIWKAPAGSRYDSAPDGCDDWVLLKGYGGAGLFHLSDGRPVGAEEAAKDVPAALYWSMLDTNRIGKKLPENGLPPAFRKYMDADSGGLEFGVPDRNNLKQVRALRVWMDDPRSDLGDILLVPALLKGDNAMLVGIRLPQNEVVFQVPMLYFAGLPQDDFDEGAAFLFGVKKQDPRRALLLVGDKLGTFKVYAITRPPMK
jgi:hypothetical protein